MILVALCIVIARNGAQDAKQPNMNGAALQGVVAGETIDDARAIPQLASDLLGLGLLQPGIDLRLVLEIGGKLVAYLGDRPDLLDPAIRPVGNRFGDRETVRITDLAQLLKSGHERYSGSLTPAGSLIPRTLAVRPKRTTQAKRTRDQNGIVEK